MSSIEVELEGQTVVGLNGGPHFKFTPAMSFFVWCDTKEEMQVLWQRLSTGGKIRKNLANEPWAQEYAWTSDKFGVEWQLLLFKNKQKFAPAFLFVDELFGKGEEAIHFYMSLFEDSKIEVMNRDEETQTIMQCVFSLAGRDFVMMEGPGSHGYTFSPAFSLIVNCETQEEIDQYWVKLSEGGLTQQCGWLQDKYGVSWQIVPTILSQLISDPDSAKSERVMKALLEINKIDIKTLEEAYA